MKILVLFALSAVTSAAMAVVALPPVSTISITGTSDQFTSISKAIVTNKANGSDSEALQNVASNAGNVTISGKSMQTAIIKDLAFVTNEGEQGSIAQQNLASNVGKVTVKGYSEQGVNVQEGAIVANYAGKDAIAQQSLSSNVGDVTIGGGGFSFQTTSVGPLAAVLNSAYGYDAKAVQNISSNNSCSTFTCANTVR